MRKTAPHYAGFAACGQPETSGFVVAALSSSLGDFMSNDYDEYAWDDPNNSSDIVFPTVAGVAVYRNPHGNVVIRQQAGPLDDDDICVIIPIKHVPALVLALQEETAE